MSKTAPWVNFTNIFFAAYNCAYPKRVKKTDSLTIFFALLGSGHIKASCKLLVKLTPCLPHKFSIAYPTDPSFVGGHPNPEPIPDTF